MNGKLSKVHPLAPGSVGFRVEEWQFARIHPGSVQAGEVAIQKSGDVFDASGFGLVTEPVVETGSVARDGGIDGAGPVVDAAGEGLGVVESLISEPHGDRERTLPVMAEDDDAGVGVEFVVGARRDLAHRHKNGVGQVGGLILPRFADVDEDGSACSGAQAGELLGGDLGIEWGGGRRGHRFRIIDS